MSITRRTALAAPAALAAAPALSAHEADPEWIAESRTRVCIAAGVLGVDPAPFLALTAAEIEDIAGMEWARKNLPGVSLDWLFRGDPSGLIASANMLELTATVLEEKTGQEFPRRKDRLGVSVSS